MYRLVFCILHLERRPPRQLLQVASSIWFVIQEASESHQPSKVEIYSSVGNVVRYGPNRISINTNTALETIYSIHSNTQKSSFYSIFNAFFKVPGSMTTINKAHHGFKRRVTSQALTATATKNMEATLRENLRTFCRGLVDNNAGDCQLKPGTWSTTRNMTDHFGRLMFDIIGDLCFGCTWNKMNRKDNLSFLSIIPDGVAGLLLVRLLNQFHSTTLVKKFGEPKSNTKSSKAGHMPIILKLRLDQIFFRELTNKTRRFLAWTESRTEQRLAEHNDVQNDIFQSFRKAKDPITEKGLTSAELNSEVITVVVAGKPLYLKPPCPWPKERKKGPSALSYSLDRSKGKAKGQHMVKP